MERNEPPKYVVDSVVDSRHTSDDLNIRYAGTGTDEKKLPGNKQAIYHSTSSDDLKIDSSKSMEPFEVQARQVKLSRCNLISLREMQVCREKPFIECTGKFFHLQLSITDL